MFSHTMNSFAPVISLKFDLRRLNLRSMSAIERRTSSNSLNDNSLHPNISKVSSSKVHSSIRSSFILISHQIRWQQSSCPIETKLSCWHPNCCPTLFSLIFVRLVRKNLFDPWIPSRLIIDFQAFTPENGLLTSSMKLCRYKLAAHYSDRLKSTVSTTSVQQRLKQIIESVCGAAVDEQQMSLISSGTDSLSTVRLSKMIEKDLGVSIPLHILFDPNITLQHLTDLIDDPSQLQSLSASTLSQLATEYRWDPPSITSKQRKVSTIFITGTTGFVGAFSWLSCCECIRLIVEWSAWFEVMILFIVCGKRWSSIASGTMPMNIVSLFFMVICPSLLSDLTNKHFNRW